MRKDHTRRVVARFERAVDSYNFRGTIPYGESEEAAEVYDAIVIEYEREKKSLLNMIDRLNHEL